LPVDKREMRGEWILREKQSVTQKLDERENIALETGGSLAAL
jgi:hypothetical protein